MELFMLPTCSFSSLSWFISLSFFCISSCCCCISSKCNNSSWRRSLTWPVSVRWLELCWRLSASGGFSVGLSSFAVVCSFRCSVLVTVQRTKLEIVVLERKIRLSARVFVGFGGVLFPVDIDSDFRRRSSFVVFEAISVAITICKTFWHVLSNTLLKL